MENTEAFNINPKNIVKEGWLQKKKVNLRTWSKRYFYLLCSGKFVGFKEKPIKDCTLKLCNNFSIIDCKISSEYDSKYYYINLKCHQFDTCKPAQRVFGFTSLQERDEWLESIKKISRLNKVSSPEEIGSQETSDTFLGPSSVRTINDYMLHKVLGEGSFGKVILASDKLTREVFAIKGIDKKRVRMKQFGGHVEEEIKVMKTINHPFLSHMKCFFQDESYIYLVMEFIQGGEIFYHLDQAQYFSENRTRLYVAEISLALDYLHSKDIIYRDIKLENIMIDDEGHIKLTDFGLCKTDISRKLAKTFCGTPEYLAPEFTKLTHYGVEVDWWSLGVVCYEMLTGQSLFATPDNTKLEKVLQLICTANVRFSDSWKKCLAPETQEFTLMLLIKEPKERLGSKKNGGFQSIKSHPFFASLNWDDVLNRRVTPEFIPNLEGKLDTSLFDTMFTKQSVDFVFPDLPSGAIYEESHEESSVDINHSSEKMNKSGFEMNL